MLLMPHKEDEHEAQAPESTASSRLPWEFKAFVLVRVIEMEGLERPR